MEGDAEGNTPRNKLNSYVVGEASCRDVKAAFQQLSILLARRDNDI